MHLHVRCGRLAARTALFVAMVTLAAGLSGCGPDPASKQELPAPQVTVAPPVQQLVTHYEYATGRTEPLEQVEVRARVSGYLKAIKFKPGFEVKKGDVLFEIDREPFDADLAKAKANEEVGMADKAAAEAQLMLSDARLVFTKSEFKRQEDQFNKGGGSQKDLDKAKSDFDESAASVKSAAAKIKQAVGNINEAKSEVTKAELNVGYCTIKAEITGIIGDKLVDVGNLVNANQTKLTTIVAVDKMDVGFDVDESTYQRIQRAVTEKKIVMPAPGEVPAEAGLGIDNNTFPLKGKISFQDNKFDPKTGTTRMKARFDNPLPETGKRLLSAGMYMKVRVPIGAPAEAMLVPDVAFGSDQGTRFLYIIGPENKVMRLNALVRELVGNLRVVESVNEPGKSPRSLTLQDRIVVGGVQRVRPGLTVDPVPMPASK